MNCRHCNTKLKLSLIDLGSAPPSNAYLTEKTLHAPEKWLPLRVSVCENCWLVQTEDYIHADKLFGPDYAYFSSTSSSWLDHSMHYVEKITQQLELGSESLVIEVASNDGYLLKNFVAANIPCLGIEPTDSTADVAEAQSIPVLRKFFGEALGKQLVEDGKQADLIVGNNVYAHVPDINDFTAGLKATLKDDGTITLEFPHLLNLIEKNQFDTIYHEHFSYLSLYTVRKIFFTQGLRIYDVEQLPTHGGSLRIYGCHHESHITESPAVQKILQLEQQYGLQQSDTYQNFQQRADKVKNDLLCFLIQQKQAGKTVVAYGAAAKGNTLLNYAGIKPDLLPFVCDAAPAKQGKYMPGSQIPILTLDALEKKKPDYVLVLPWNIVEEVKRHLASDNIFKGSFVTAVPQLRIIER
jgi:SAM-dependent methyltransferase